MAVEIVNCKSFTCFKGSLAKTDFSRFCLYATSYFYLLHVIVILVYLGHFLLGTFEKQAKFCLNQSSVSRVEMG